MSSGWRGLIFPAVTTAVLFGLLVSLGVWQLRRLQEKESIISRIETRAGAAPQIIPPRGEWAALKPDDYEFRRVRARGRYLDGRAALLFSHTPEGFGQEPGYVVAAPFALAEGGVMFVERGFVPVSKSTNQALLAPPDGEIELTGLLRAPQGRNAFTPKDDLARGVFFTRDPVAIAAWRGVADVAPFALALDATPGATSWPRPVPGVPQVTNNHLSYALTWFSLASAIVVVFALYARDALGSKRRS